MGRKKQANALSKCYSLKVSEEQFNLVQSLSKADKANLNNIMRELVNRFVKIKVYQNNPAAENTENTENKSLPKKIKVNQNKDKSLPKKQTEKSLYEQYKEDKAREDYNKSINRLFEER
jgi:hypothetical protein